MISCAECHIGHMHPTRATYLQPLSGQFLVFPNAPAGRCDVCGHIEFDTFFTDMMEALLMDSLDQEPADMLIQSLMLGSSRGGWHRFKMM